MADAMVERRPSVRFFCHRCNIEFEDVLQESLEMIVAKCRCSRCIARVTLLRKHDRSQVSTDYTCPYCASGFIEQLENEAEGMALSSDDFSDADMSNIEDMSNIDEMSNLDDSDEVHHMTHGTPPMLNDLAFLMSGGRLRGPGRRDTLMEQLVWMIGGARPGSGAVTAGAPFVLVGAPGDYVFGGEGLDAVVTQLLGQLENAGPPPLPREQIAALPSQQVTAEQTAANAACSVCWENFQLDETVSRLECDHIFHSTCIAPWLQLHATCPICRRSLLPEEPADAPPGSAPAPAAAAPAPEPPSTQTQDSPVTPASISVNTPLFRVPVSFSHVVLRRRLAPSGWESADSSGSSAGTGATGVTGLTGSPSTASTGSSVTASGVWAPLARDSTSNSTASLSSDRDRQYNMDIEFD